MSETLEVALGRMLSAAGLKIALAESCTGGLITSRLTDVPGSSGYVEGGVVAYSYEAKERLLGVSQDTLLTFGAVSAETALEMARGVRSALHADLGVGVTGIAGPGGGMPGKPVGLVYMALSAADWERCERHVWESDRIGNKRLSAEAALRLIQTYLEWRALCDE
jgi:PncC family amidohydrolase